MKPIASFTIDHMKLLPGVYVSRKDTLGNETITTFDIRITRPNFEPVMNTGEIHTIEHLAATYLRNQKDYGSKIVYFGPMGCRTGFYLLLGGNYTSKEIIPLMVEMFEYIRDFDGEIPGATAENCGNYTDMDLVKAQHYAKHFLDTILYQIDDAHLIYPES
ncbi:MAG: S-ribosylhomocysteine lyase [Clostridiales bacterium]|jgi:S-ribosylhomocysteine lyase|nr:S-ribosylhomocysteine lyase [Clostridiales bacterium]